MVEGHENAIMTLTTAADLAQVVAKAVEFEGPWPTIGGICGNRVTFSEIMEIGHRVRGKKKPGPTFGAALQLIPAKHLD